MLDPQTREIGDVEKASVVHRRKRNAPIGEAVVLAFQQAMQQRRADLAAIGGEANLSALLGGNWMPVLLEKRPMHKSPPQIARSLRAFRLAHRFGLFAAFAFCQD